MTSLYGTLMSRNVNAFVHQKTRSHADSLVTKTPVLQTIHTRGEADTETLFRETYNRILGIEPIKDTNMPASWGHMVGYDAQYYGYLVSIKVFSPAYLISANGIS